MESPDVVLVSCYALGHQPFDLASPLAMLSQAGVAAYGLDLAVQDVAEHTSEFCAARFVGFSVPMHTSLRLGEKAARQVQDLNPQAHICFYGDYAELNSEYLLRDIADTTVAGEYEPALLNLVKSVLRGEFDAESPPEYIRTEQFSGGPSLARFSFEPPLRDGLPHLDNYAKLRQNGDLRLTGYTETSRGCKYRCLHCPITPIYDGRFFVVQEDIVMGDIRAQVASGARHISFGDPDFLNGPGHARRIVRSLHTEFPELTFNFTTRISHLLHHADILPELASGGCTFVISAVESLSDVVLAALEKGHTRTDVVQAFQLMDDVGIPLRPSFVAFTPWTTLEDYLELLALVREYDLVDNVDPVQWGIRLLLPPGSALLDKYSDAPWLGEIDEANYTYTWIHPDPRMEVLHRQVTSSVNQAERQGQGARHTFSALEELAYAVAPAQLPLPRIVPERRPKAPGLTESWFC